MNYNQVLAFDRIVRPLFEQGMHVLEIGPDGHPSTFEQRVPVATKWESAELAEAVDESGQRRWGPPQGTGATYWMTDEYVVPCGDDTFDVVFSANVLEHVRHIWRWMPELCRVVKSGGLVITISPLSWPYHESPVDCWRVYPEGMRALSEQAGLDVVRSEVARDEPPRTRRFYLGEGALSDPRRAPWRFRIQRLIGWPMAVAADTVTVARKP